MNRIKVKICGLKREKDVELCMSLGVDVLGFVVEYPVPVPWNLNCMEAAPLLDIVRLNRYSGSSQRSCIVTGGTPKKVVELAKSLKPSLVQLHYNETFQDTAIIIDELKKLNIGVIKTIPPKVEDRMSQFGTDSIETIVKKLCEKDVFALLADSRTPENSSNKGTLIDVDFVRQIIKLSSKPVVIAGGINANNVEKLIDLTGAYFIDIMSGVESIPGVKDAELLSKLISITHVKF